ncbi:MAG: DUF4251 domain-containing protein [Candidatus Pedobacter colombiensis]|uniref:DUF4251 domain-containing protein n=1 Tax=Candidatus Pedobacter colombiensis TaxID=3121371 RepID=A0AAJ5WA13_9SPHI|nr:DUF4251 domain-containing protein [Pedobacter sp.]WEK19047.1 MAG: DUF4251 domain-containing protein [Pedobacter sp.]
MKTVRNILVLATLLIAIQVNAQTDKATTIKVIDNQHYIFNATSAMPMANNDVNRILSRMPGNGGGGTIQLSGAQYQLIVTKDSIEAYLPYYGRAYSATLNPDDAGIKFKSKNFTYKAEKKKKGSWIITMNFKDAKDTQSMILNVSDNGYGTLSVNSNTRQSISFNGFISEPKEKKE